MAGSQATRDWSSWVTRTTLLGSVGVCAALLLWGPLHLAVVGVPVSLLVAVAHFLCRGDHDGRARGWTLWRSVLRVSMCAIGLILTVSVTAALSPALGLLVVLALAATTPPVRGRLLRFRDTRPPEPSKTPESPALLHVPARLLSDAELCQAWRRSSAELGRTRDASGRLALVATRQLLLDEVWTRHRHELETWVACGARAHDGTQRFFDAP